MFQVDFCGGLLYNNLTIFRQSVYAFPVTGFHESRAGQSKIFLARKDIIKI